MFRTSLTTLAAALAIALTTTSAQAVGNLVDVQVVDRTTGQAVTPIFHHGEWWIAGKPGAKYSVALLNRDGRRTLSVISIDGVNAISGDTAAWNQTGYVLDPYERSEIAGWRKNMNQIAAFEFASLPDSYAARTGRPANVGVIGIAVFDEKQRILPPWRGDADLGEMRRAAPPSAMPASPAPDAAASKAQNLAESARIEPLQQRDRLGTAHGEIEQSSIRNVAFQRARSEPNEIVTIHYDRLENLIAMGIVPRPIAPVATNVPNPFPGSQHFVPDPLPR